MGKLKINHQLAQVKVVNFSLYENPFFCIFSNHANDRVICRAIFRATHEGFIAFPLIGAKHTAGAEDSFLYYRQPVRIRKQKTVDTYLFRAIL